MKYPNHPLPTYQNFYTCLLIGCFCFLISYTSLAQNEQKILVSAISFIEQVKKNHPVAKLANLMVNMADQDVLSARGGFDPALQIDGSSKTFDAKNYYYYTNPELSIPLPVGNIRTGLENSGGDFLNPEVTTGRTSYFGIELPLARGLITDKRRAALQQAKLLRSQTQQERLLVLNNLLFDAYQTYWQWAGNYEMYSVYAKFVENANNRLRLVKIAFQNGDRSAMDTLEAFTQVQNYRIAQNEAEVKLNNAAFEVANFLWQDNDSAWQLTEKHIPDSLGSFRFVKRDTDEALIYLSDQQNPIFKAYDYKIQGLEVDRRLQSQNLLPYFTVKANLLYKEYSLFKSLDPVFIQNNYKWGFDFRMPLFLREERGKYQKAKLKLKEANLELSNKKQQTNNKIRSYFNESKLLEQQLVTIKVLQNNYASLLRNEELKLTQGESSLFMVNSREIKVIEAMNKKIELSVKYLKSKYAADWSAGILD